MIALKDSQAVERLTRITILLAKGTILFLPISLMSQYFSIQIPDIAAHLSLRAYWIAFAVLMVLSIGLLSIFGYLSDTVEGKTMYRSVTRTLFNSSKQKSIDGMLACVMDELPPELHPKPESYFYKRHRDHAGFKAPPDLQQQQQQQQPDADADADVDAAPAGSQPKLMVQPPSAH